MDIIYADATKVQGTFMEDLGKGVLSEKAAHVRIDNLCYVKSHSMFCNNLDHLERLKQRYEIQQSIGRRVEFKGLLRKQNSWL